MGTGPGEGEGDDAGGDAKFGSVFGEEIDSSALDASRARLAKARVAKAATQASIERALWDEAEHLWALGEAERSEIGRTHRLKAPGFIP